LKKKHLHSLTRKSEFKSAFEQGRKFPSKHLILYILRNDLTHSRIGLAVGRKTGNAVTRNKVKRRLREIFRRLFAEYPLCCDIVAVARSTAAEAAYRDLDRDIRKVFAGLTHEKTFYSNHQTL